MAVKKGEKWANLKNQVLQDIEQERLRRDAIIPRDQKDIGQWKAYYQVRTSRLGNEALTLPSRMLWINTKEKTKIIEKYLDLLDRLISGKDVETKVHEVESKMQSMISAEGEKIRTSHPQFFESGQGGI